jgi:ppGpp synthetase/RelA/SpoT-type nucleotidyltranferase
MGDWDGGEDDAVTVPSKSAVNAAGERLRVWSGSADPLGEAGLQAFQSLWDYRASFQVPLTKVVMGVRSNMQAERLDTVVAQRLKRLPTILDKLKRHPEMKLSRMHDIGGCRAIVPSGRFDAIDRLRARVARSRSEVIREYDYIASPKDTGYRAVHVVVQRDDRLIEIQLRTFDQHRWAETVERLNASVPGIKDGRGPDDLVEYLRRAAYLIHETESERTIDPATLVEYNDLGHTVAHYFNQG